MESRARLILATPLCLALAALVGVAPARGAADGFVRREGTHFRLGCQRFYYLGTSCYYLAHYAQSTEPGPLGTSWREMADEVLDRAASLGLRVIRIWAFNEKDDAWSLQTSPGVYREQALAGYDYVLDAAARRGLFLVLTLVNNWDDYGGMNWYVRHSPTAAAHDAFYTDAACRQWYRAHVATLAGRTNTLNGRVYRDDPTIFAWQLANEPRCKSDTTGATLRDWVWDMAAYVKSVDSNHMVSTGEEGWTGAEPWEGTRWLLNNASPDVDYTVAHCWPDHWTWLWGTATPGLYSNAMAWVRSHLADAGGTLGKPFVLSEYGKARPLDGAYGRHAYYQGWFETMRANAAADGPAAGLHFWMLEADGSGHDDGFGVLSADAATLALLRAQADAMNALIAPQLAELAGTAAGVRLGWTRVVGDPHYRIERSADLRAWEPHATVSSNAWLDTDPPAGPCFYRVVPEHYPAAPAARGAGRGP